MRNVAILGMHRSGTSMVASAMASAGIYVGAEHELLSDQEDNPNGFWERRDVVNLNDEILAACGSSWFDPAGAYRTASGSTEYDAVIASVLGQLETGAGQGQSWLLKDPRMVLTWPWWERSLGDAVIVYVYRDPCAVATSLNRRHGFPLAFGMALWEIYNHAALRTLSGRDVVAVSFNALSSQPAEYVSRLLEDLAAFGVTCATASSANTFKGSLVRSAAGAGSSPEGLLVSAAQHRLADYCEAYCRGEQLPPMPRLEEGIWPVVADMAAALAPLATVVETANERDELSVLCEERTGERDRALAQLTELESNYASLVRAHRDEVALHKTLEAQHQQLMSKHQALSDEYGEQSSKLHNLEQEHSRLSDKAELLFAELSGVYGRLIDFRQSWPGRLLHQAGRAYKLVTGRRGTHTRFDDALADAHRHFDRYELKVSDPDSGAQGEVDKPASARGKLSLLGEVVKYVARNPAGSARSFSLARLQRATAVFLQSDPNDLGVWVDARFPDQRRAGASDEAIDPENLDPFYDELELVFPAVDETPDLIDVSIIIPVYNDYRMTMYCLQALLKNTSGVTYEVIIGDDCSTDLTASIGERVSNITVVRGDKNRGFLENCNRAAARARGRHVLFLNNDTGVCSGWLAYLIDILERDPQVGIAGPKLLFADGKLQEAGGIVWCDASAWNFGRMDAPDKPEYNFVREVDYISGACLLVRGELWRQLGGFDTRYKPAYYEDTDIAFAARAAGYKVVYQPLSEVVHFEGVSNGIDVGSGIKQYQVTNQEKFRQKWQAELQQFHFPNAEKVFLARDRSRGKRCVLFIDHYVPHYDKDAGSRSTFMYVQLMLDMGYKVLFLGANYFPHQPYTQVLQQMGVEVLVGEYMARNQDKWLKDNAPYIDRIYLHRPHIAEQLLASLDKMKPRPPVIFFGHDLHYLRIGREEKVVGDAALAKSAQKWKKREYAVFDRVDKIYYPSQVEVDEIKSQRPDLDVRAIPLYVLESGVSEEYCFEATSDILFVGGFNHPPNADGICWFVDDVLPLVREQCPGIKLHIVGSNPTDAVLDLQSEEVNVYGYLSDEELGALYRRVRQVIVPLRFGAGVKGKVLEAIQKNVPLVTTSVGAEGIPDAEAVMSVADTAEDFAASVVGVNNGDTNLLRKMRGYQPWLAAHFSRDNASRIVLEDFGSPVSRPSQPGSGNQS